MSVHPFAVQAKKVVTWMAVGRSDLARNDRDEP
jgi:hypothetical protein